MTKLDPRRASLCSMLAIATALMVGASPAAAQALLGTVTSSSGVGTITNNSATTLIPVTSSQAVINWSATGPSNGGVTTFSSPGSSASFTGTRDFAILNRVAPTISGNSIFMGGDVSSSINGQVGGTVYFYSPNGIIVGGDARFNVGSLGLTTSPIADVEGTWMSGFGTGSPSVSFGPASAGSFVRTEHLAALNANGPGNYIALVAPQVVHRGAIRTDGAAALVGASAATITFRTNSLFDIAVTTGTSDANGVVVDGGSIARNNPAIGGNHAAYLVAVPANNAMTMIVQNGSSLGFDIAGSAFVEGNAVILSSGHDITAGSASAVSSGAAGSDGDIDLVDSSFSSRVSATAVDRIFAHANAGTVRFSDDLTVRARIGQIEASGTGTQFLIDGNLDVDVSNVATTTGANAASAGFNILSIGGATMTIAGSAAIDASARGGYSGDAATASGSATGGTVFLQAQSGSTLNFNTGLTVDAGGTAGLTGVAGINSGNGQGGEIFLDSVTGGSRINVAGPVSLQASGNGGNASGGSVAIRTFIGADNNITVTGPALLVAEGTGSDGNGGAAGSGTGGLALVSTGTTGLVSLGALTMDASGFGGDHLAGAVAGTGSGGSANVIASGGGTISIGPAALISAEGVGGSSAASGGTGGAADGGDAQLLASGGTLTMLGDVDLFAGGSGGDGDAAGGAADGGFTHLGASLGGDLTVEGSATLISFGFGGSGHAGGRAAGGSASIDSAGAGSSLGVSGAVFSSAFAFGGSGSIFTAGGIGGNAVGGSTSITAADGASLGLESINAFAIALGGDGASGGNASGGQIRLGASGAESSLDIAFSTFLNGVNSGGAGYGGAGGSGTGGRIDIVADRGTVTLGDLLFASADGLGGRTESTGTSGGTGRGGEVHASAANGGTLTTLSALSLQANGVGGGNFEGSAASGAGFGGTVGLDASGAGSIVDARFTVSLSADGHGGFAGGECTDCGGGGADGTGGNVSAGTSGGLGNRLLLGGDLFLSASGTGSAGDGGAGGNGLGGGAFVNLNDDGKIAVSGSLVLVARGGGGDQSNGAVAGNGTGGEAAITLAGSPVALLQVEMGTLLDTGGQGGSSFGAGSGAGGSGLGGWSRIYGTGGQGNFTGAVTISAAGSGGASDGGTGGTGSGGRARLNADGAEYHVSGGLALDANSTGGLGAGGGTAAAQVIGNESNVAVLANHGGSILVDGATSLSADASGGNASGGGNGGSATAGGASVIVSGSAAGNGSIRLADVDVTANANGGSGGFGGALAGSNGGDATGGLAELSINNSASGTNRLTTGAALIEAVAFGGNGGLGGNGAIGERGGSGGTGAGGSVTALTAAGNGALGVTNLSMFATGTGGDGGDGGQGNSGLGGSGGAGGTGDGGNVIAGIVSGTATATTEGRFNADSLTGWADSYGGDGGNGGTGTAGSGNGGNGGDALYSFNQLIARGGTVTIGSAQLLVDTLGGDGGSGALRGNGGTAFTADVLVTATNRFEQPAAGATLRVDDLHFYSIAHASSGEIAGRAIALGGPELLVQNSNADFGSFSMVAIAGDGLDPESVADRIRIINGAVTVDNDFHFETDHRLSVLVDNGSLSAGAVTLDAATFERDATPPSATGTISGGSISVLSGQDIVLDASLSSVGPLTLDAPGSVAVGNLATTGTAGDVEVIAGGDVSTGTITASRSVDVSADGALAVGNVSAGESILLAADGALTAGNLSAGLLDNAIGEGADYNIGILSATSVAIGDASARDWIGIGTRGALSTGAIASGNDVLLAADGAITTGAITTGAQSRLLVAGADMVALGGPIDAFDRGQLFAALGTSAEAATLGAVTVRGPVTTARMDALVGGDFTTGAVTASSEAHATVGGTMIINGAWTSPLSRIASNDLQIGASGGIGGGQVDLVSRNATQLLVGDGLSGSGYAIDNAEFGRLSAGTIRLLGRSDASAATDTLVGALNLAGRSGGSSVTIATASGDSGQPGGSLRVTGAVAGTGFGANDSLTLAAGRVEIDAASGGVSLTGNSSQLGGALSLAGQRIHVAEAAILDRLAADPNYAARDAELAAPPATQRPDGVVRAGEIFVELVAPSGETGASPYSVLVQNVGTEQLRAGFTTTTAEIVSPEGAAPGSIGLNVNGQLVTSTGTLTGVAVRDALMAEDSPARFTATSRINGCALTGPCGAIVPPPDPGPQVDPQPAISTEIALLGAPTADDALFGNEEAIEDNEEEGGEDSASSPISPPNPLFNTKPLEQKGETDEPVSGGGNPALIGSTPVEGAQ